MKTELKTLIYSMINNLIIAIIKIVSGLFFKLGSLLADGLHTLSDFITDIVCFIGAKISKKKPTKYHPFGFGKVEYLTNLFVGVLLFLLSCFIIIHGFLEESVIPPLTIIYILLFTFILKLIAIAIMHKIGKDINSHTLIISVEESKADLYSSFVVMLITILLQFSNKYPFLKYTDILGSIFVGLIVLKTALKIIIDNSLSIIGEVEEDGKHYDKVASFLEQYNQEEHKKIEDYDIDLIQYGAYYKLQLTLQLQSTLSLRQVTNFVNKLKKSLKKHRSLNIKYVTIYVTDKIERN